MESCGTTRPKISNNEGLYQEYSLEQVLEEFGIATLGSCIESEPGFLQLEFPSIDDLEEFLTLLLVAMGNKPIREPEADDFLSLRMFGSSIGCNASWKFEAHPMDCRDLLRGEKKSVIPYAVALKVSLRFPKTDYPQITKLLIEHYR